MFLWRYSLMYKKYVEFFIFKQIYFFEFFPNFVPAVRLILLWCVKIKYFYTLYKIIISIFFCWYVYNTCMTSTKSSNNNKATAPKPFWAVYFIQQLNVRFNIYFERICYSARISAIFFFQGRTAV